jgi:cytochrome c553
MSFFLTKIILGTLFLLAGITAVTAMLTIMGKQDKKISPIILRKIHKTGGAVFFILMLINGFLGLRYWAMTGDQISTRAVLHAVLALGLIIILIIKVSIVRIFKNFLRFAPTLGITVFCLGFIVFSISGGYYSLRSLLVSPVPIDNSGSIQTSIKGNEESGAALFVTKCSSCHHADREDKKHGPGLLNLLKKETLPESGKPATIENVKSQLKRPFMAMPAFTNLTEQELADLMAYLKTL